MFIRALCFCFVFFRGRKLARKGKGKWWTKWCYTHPIYIVIKSIAVCNLVACKPWGLADVFLVSQQCFYKFLQASESRNPLQMFSLDTKSVLLKGPQYTNKYVVYVRYCPFMGWSQGAGISEDVEKLEPSYIAGMNVKWCYHCGAEFGRTLIS